MSEPIPVDDEASVSLVRQRVRALADELGFDTERREAATIVASELGHNQVRHARLGEIWVRPVQRGGVAGIEIDAVDMGAGFADPVSAFRGQLRRGGEGLGIGLAAVRRLATEVDVDTRNGRGARVVARTFAGEVSRLAEVAIVGEPRVNELVSGDDAVFVRTDRRLVVALADGLGHGKLAQQASTAACAHVRAHADRRPLEIVDSADAAIRGTRGAALAVAALDLETDELEVCIAGNIRAGVYAPNASKRFAYVPRIVGSGRGRRLREERVPRNGGALVLFTDGLPERTDPGADRPGTTGWPLRLAWRLLVNHGRSSDDSTVLALR